MEVWLCDLTYTQQSISSDAIPYAIGGIASYINEKAEELNVLSNSLKTMFKSDLGAILTNLNEVTKLINDLNTMR